MDKNVIRFDRRQLSCAMSIIELTDELCKAEQRYKRILFVSNSLGFFFWQFANIILRELAGRQHQNGISESYLIN